MAARAPGRLDAIVLAGGQGSRLRAALPNRQKVTAPVGGRPFLARLIDWLASAGADRVVLAAGHRSADVQEVVDAYPGSGPELRLSIEPCPLGTAGAVRLAAQQTESDPVLVLNGDSFADIDLAAFRAFHADRQAEASLALVPSPAGDRYGSVDVDATGSVLSFREKSARLREAAAINAGIYLFRREMLARLPERYPLSLEHDVFPRLIGSRFYAMLFKVKFIDIGTPESLQAAAQFFGVGGVST